MKLFLIYCSTVLGCLSIASGILATTEDELILSAVLTGTFVGNILVLALSKND